MFSMSRASAGEGPERYSLRVPFECAAGESLKLGIDLFDIDGKSIRLVGSGTQYVLRVSHFDSPDHAEAYLDRLVGVLLRMTVGMKLGLRVETSLQDIRLFDPPKEVTTGHKLGDWLDQAGWTHLDGAVDPFPAAIIPEHKRLLLIAGDKAHAVVGVSAGNFKAGLETGFALPTPEAIPKDARLSLGIDLYAASRHETTSRGRLVTMVTAVESLVVPGRVPAKVVQAIDNLLAVLGAGAIKDELGTEWSRLASRVGNLKTESIKNSLRSHVANIADAIGGSPDELADGMSQSYDVRSLLLHEGSATDAEIGIALTWLNEWVPRILVYHSDVAGGAL